jgi:exonuclease III
MSPLGQNPMARFFQQATTNPTDETWQGDNVSGNKEPNVTRVMFHNVNGISLNGTEGLDMFVNEQKTLDVDIQGITEHCLDTTKYQVYQTAQEIVRSHAMTQSRISLHSSEEPAVNIYKPGGTGFLLLGDVVGRLESNGTSGDSMGRWSAVHFRRRNQSPITIITAYQVCPRPTNLLGNTAFHQQVRALSKSGRPDIHPRQAFITDLEAYIADLQTNGNDIILGGDFNEALEDRRSGILRLATARNLSDPFLYQFPHHTKFGTHASGTRRIDMVFLSPNLITALHKIGYAPYHFSKPSDHRPILLEFKTSLLFGYSNMHLQSPPNRVVKTKDKSAVTRFITEWFKYISANQGFTLQQQIDKDQIGPDIVEQVDNIIGRGGAQAEASCKRRRPEFYSRQLVQQRVRVSTLRCHLRSLRLGVDRTLSLTNRLQRCGIDLYLPPTIQSAITMLSTEVSTLRQLSQEHKELRQKELEERVLEASSRGNKTCAQIIRAIKTSETYQQTFQILRNLKRKSSPSQQIDRVEIPMSWPPPHTPLDSISNLEDPKLCTEWRLVTLPAEVEYYLLLRNRLHFGQAEGTPFTREPL